MDDQVKLHGYRIELAEIELVYANIGAGFGVAKVIVLVRNDKLVLYLQMQTGITLTSDALAEIKTKASRELTHYMIPS
jgi:acyl-coenzyme A synthetase/AMP-(fatty) acid ligase